MSALLSGLWLGLWLATPSVEGFKLQALANLSVMDMEGAAHVAQVAYENQLISSNVQKALSNVSSFLEAAHSAGLHWTNADAEMHIRLTAHGLKKSIALLESDAPRLAGSFMANGKKHYDGLSNMLDEDDKADLQDEALGATVSLLTSWAATGQPPTVQNIAELGFGLATMAIGMFNPLLGAVAGMAFSLIGGLIFPEEESPMEKMYKQIMEEVGVAIKTAQIQGEVENAKSELGAVMDELQWMPPMLGGVGTTQSEPSPDQARTLLTYNIMIQHDIAKMAFKIQNSATRFASISLCFKFFLLLFL